MCLLANSISSLEKCLFRSSAHFFYFIACFLLRCMSCLLCRLIPCQSHNLQIFSHILCCLLILLMLSFAVQKLLSLIRSLLYIFVFISISLGERKKVKSSSCVRVFVTPWTLWDSTDWSLPGSSLHGIFQARVLEWVAISFSRGSS